MITEFLIKILENVLNFILQILPKLESLPGFISESWEWFGEQTARLIYMIPMFDLILSILAVILTVEGAIITWKLLDYVYNKVRGSG